MSRFGRYVREKVVKVLVTALVAGSVAGNEGITVQAAGADLNDPFSFVLYTNEFVSSNLDHIEGNAAIRELKVSMVSYGGKSYLGDLSAPNQILKYTASGRTDEKELIIPLTNSDGTQNSVEREVTGQGYNIIVGENKLYTGNLLKNCEIWDTDIASEISNVLAGNMVQKSKDLYAMANEDSDTRLVLNVTSAELNSGIEEYDKKITGAAFYGKTVVVNVSDSGTVNITGWMNAHGAKKQALEHQLWADRIIWNFGNATEVNVNSIFGYILAPNATVYNGGTVVGGIIADKYKQGGEIHCPCEPDEPEPTPTPTVPVVTEEPTPTPVVTEEPTPTPVVTEEPTPTPVVTEEPTPTATPDTPDEPDTPDDTPDDPGTPNNPSTPADPGTPAGGIPDTPQVLGARRRRMVTIEDEAVPLADRAVLGASRRPQTSDDSDAWNLGFAFSLTSLGAWLVLKRKEH